MQSGAAWQVVSGDDFYGQPYYTQPIQASGTNTQAFTGARGRYMGRQPYQPRVGLRFHWWIKSGMRFPRMLRTVVPLRMITGLLAGERGDTYITRHLGLKARMRYHGTRAPESLRGRESCHPGRKRGEAIP